MISVEERLELYALEREKVESAPPFRIGMLEADAARMTSVLAELLDAIENGSVKEDALLIWVSGQFAWGASTMDDENLEVRVEVLEQRLSRVTGVVMGLLEAIRVGDELRDTARNLRAVLQGDL